MSKVQDYKCLNCAAPLVFNVETQKLTCHSCGTEMETEAFQAYDEALKANENQAEEEFCVYTGVCLDAEMSAYTCRSCGGELLSDETTVATECPYCGNTAIAKTRLTNTLRPDFVIPFKIDKHTAKKALQDFYKNKFLLPKFFKEDNRVDKITGIYIPFWLYSCGTQSTGMYNATSVKTWIAFGRRYTKTSHYLLKRAASLSFDKIPAGASKRLNQDEWLEALEPYYYLEMKPFSMAYLSGFLADRYDVDAASLQPRIDKRIRSSINKNLRRMTGGYTTVTKKSLHVDMKNSEIQYALLPVWVLNTKWNNNIYTFMINGQTGKLVGELPISWKKAGVIGISIFAAAAMGCAGILLLGEPSPNTLNVINIASIIVTVGGLLSFMTLIPSVKKKMKKIKQGV